MQSACVTLQLTDSTGVELLRGACAVNCLFDIWLAIPLKRGGLLVCLEVLFTQELSCILSNPAIHVSCIYLLILPFLSNSSIHCSQGSVNSRSVYSHLSLLFSFDPWSDWPSSDQISCPSILKSISHHCHCHHCQYAFVAHFTRLKSLTTGVIRNFPHPQPTNSFHQIWCPT